MATSRPLRIAIVNDYEIVVAGVAGVLEPFADRVLAVELDTSLGVVSDVDVILYDTFGQVQGDGIDLEDLVRGGSAAKVVVFSWNVQTELVDRTLQRGAAGYLSKALPAHEIVEGIEAVWRGEVVRPQVLDAAGVDKFAWPGRAFGLTAREAEVIALITQGLTNQDIAERTYLSINSVKTYIRAAYRKIGVERRPQAVIWGMSNGFRPDTMRVIDPHGV